VKRLTATFTAVSLAADAPILAGKLTGALPLLLFRSLIETAPTPKVVWIAVPFVVRKKHCKS
jgi:hypothetical protein